MNFTYIECIDNNVYIICRTTAEAWNLAPLISQHQPIMGAVLNIDVFAITTAIAIVFQAVNHTMNHDKCSAGNNAQSEQRKSVSGFWNTQTLERVHQKWRQLNNRSLIHEKEQFYNQHTNRMPAAWSDLSDGIGKTTTVWLTVQFMLQQRSNTFGQVPLCSAITGQAGFTQGSSIALQSAITFLGIKRQGVRFVRQFQPSGPSWPMAPLFILQESISYGFRRISQGTRLYCNQFRGHQQLHLFTSLCLVPVFTLPILMGAPITVIAATIQMGQSAQETIVAVLQAGVFCLLRGFYITEVLSRKDKLANPFASISLHNNQTTRGSRMTRHSLTRSAFTCRFWWSVW